MLGKIALEEHFAVEETLSDSLPFVPPDYQAELKQRLFDFYDKRLGLMDRHGIEMMILSLNAPAIRAVAEPRKATEARPARERRARRHRGEASRPFQGFAALAMQDVDGAIEELRRTIKQLGFRGALVNGFSRWTSPNNHISRSSAIPAVLGW